MGLPTKFMEQVDAMEAMKLDWEITKDVYSKRKRESKTKKDDNISPVVTAAKAVLNKARKAWDEGETKAKVMGVHIFQLHPNLLSNKSCQPWEKIVKAQTETAP